MYELIVIGGGPAGLAAALSAYESGLRKILLVERDTELGGILNQCIHNGFGLTYFKEELTGPEYAARFIERLKDTTIEVRLDTMVLQVEQDKKVHMVSKATGYTIEESRSIVLAMGCRERTRGAIAIPGTRPAGVYTAGAAQRYVNIYGMLPGKRVVILGSGDIGLIMARRMTLEGAKVLACVELMPYSNGLNRNIVQCLQDYNIPLYLSHTVTEVRGKDRVEQIVVSQVGPDRKPIDGTEIVFDCDTLLLSVGLIPENELTQQAGIAIDGRTKGAKLYENMETSVPGIFACGNVAHVHDLVDYVTMESTRAGKAAALYVQNPEKEKGMELQVQNGNHVTYTVPQAIRLQEVEKAVQVFFRVSRTFGDATIYARSGDAVIGKWKRNHMAPGEMENVALPKVLLEKCNQPISISVEEGME